jgi:threonine aldolase
MKTKRFFASDNNAPVHPELWGIMQDANKGHSLAYGDDKYTENAIAEFKKIFSKEIEVFFTFLGTGSNVLSISALAKSYNSVLCAETAHIFEDECGAVERFSGAKLIPITTKDGKLTIELLQEKLKGVGFEHHSQVKVISITQCTELGTVYKPEEIKKISDWAHDNNLYLHMDGARIANAAAYLQKSFKEITQDVGVDILSFGGTKNGMMYGEAIIFFRKELAEDFKYIRKQGMQLASKMRYIAAPFSYYLQNDFWRKLAIQSNNMALLLADNIKKYKEIKIVYPVQSNGLFVQLPSCLVEKLQKETFFYPWNEEANIYRWMCSWDTTEDDINDFCQQIDIILKKC